MAECVILQYIIGVKPTVDLTGIYGRGDSSVYYIANDKVAGCCCQGYFESMETDLILRSF